MKILFILAIVSISYEVLRLSLTELKLAIVVSIVHTSYDDVVYD